MAVGFAAPGTQADGVVCGVCGGSGRRSGGKCVACGGDGWAWSAYKAAREEEGNLKKRRSHKTPERTNPRPPRVPSVDGESRNRDWLHPDGRCIICEEPEGAHTLQARRDCRDEYTRLAAEIEQESGTESDMATKTKTVSTKKAAAGKKATASGATMPNGQTSVEIIDSALKGKKSLLQFKNSQDAKDAAYNFWSLRRRRDAVAAVAVSLDSEAKTVTVGPQSATNGKKATKAAAAKTKTPTKKAAVKKAPAKKASKPKASTNGKSPSHDEDEGDESDED